MIKNNNQLLQKEKLIVIPIEKFITISAKEYERLKQCENELRNMQNNLMNNVFNTHW